MRKEIHLLYHFVKKNAGETDALNGDGYVFYWQASSESLTKEVLALKATLMEKDKGAEKLKQYANINLTKKHKKHKVTTSVTPDKSSVPTPKEKGNNGTKRKGYDNIEKAV